MNMNSTTENPVTTEGGDVGIDNTPTKDLLLPPSLPPTDMSPSMFSGGIGGGNAQLNVFSSMVLPYNQTSVFGANNTAKKDGENPQQCTVHPTGLPYAFDVTFPDRRLPVCQRCKKNFRSRDLCRTRDGHRALPWATTYLVVTLTDEVLSQNEDGTLSYRQDIPIIAETQNIPDLCKGPAGGFMESEPICKVCKDKNYTRDYCRNVSGHTTPPHQAVYIKIVPKTEANTLPPRKKKRKIEDGVDGKVKNDGGDNNVKDDSDDLTDIHPSKTFLVVFSATKMIVKWCEQIIYPVNAAPSQSQADQETQNNLPPFMNASSIQGMDIQSQMWEAFRAGAMWAQSQAQINAQANVQANIQANGGQTPTTGQTPTLGGVGMLGTPSATTANDESPAKGPVQL